MLKRVIRKLNRRTERSVFARPLPSFVQAFQRHNGRAFRYPISLALAKNDLIEVVEGSDRMYVGRPLRIKFYKDGVRARLKQLSSEYFLDRIPIGPGDLVIDVGANIGELSRIVGQMGARTISIEPELIEVTAMRENLAGLDHIIIHGALWHEEARLTFYSKNDSGDSSLVEMGNPKETTVVDATTLDKVYARYGRGQRVRLIKLEAEGAEPEILDGATDMLPLVDYVSADAGPERGVSKDNTVIPVFDRLSAAGFVPIAFGHVRGVMLFENKARPDG